MTAFDEHLPFPAQALASEGQTPVPGLAECLARIARQLGRPIPEMQLTSPLTLPQAIDLAEGAGIAAAFGAMPSLSRAPLLPAILTLKDGGTILVEAQIGPDRFGVFDPRFAPEPVEISRAELDARASGHALILRRKAGMTAPEQPRGHWFWSAFAGAGWLYVQVLLAAAVTNVLGLASSIFTMTVYDRILPNGATESLIALTLGIGIALVFDFLIRTLRAAFLDRAGQRADQAIGRAIFNRLLDLRLAARPGSTGALSATLCEFETLREFFTSATLIAVVDLPFILLFIGVVYLVGGPLALIPGLAVPLVLLIGVVVQPLLARGADHAFTEGQTRQAILIETLSGLDTIKTAGAAGIMRARWDEAMERQAGHGARSRAVAQFALNATAFVQQAAQVALIFWGVFLIEAGLVSMGALIAAVILTGRVLAPLAQIAQMLTRIHQARSAWGALNDLMRRRTDRESDRSYLARPRASGEVELRGVSFAYPGQGGRALQDLSLSIAPGERVAIVGRIGSGKSTIARLLTGLYQPQAGEVLLDGTDIRQMDPEGLRRDIAAVLQDVWLFSGTLRDNIAASRPHATDAEVLAAARLSGADAFISRHPQGYGLRVAERGEGLSGGQRQQIALARALITRPPVLVLDEPTSALDMQGEQALVARLKPALAGQTLIVITHRSALLDLVDRVIVLDGGKVVADGPRARLAPVRPAEGKA